MAMRRSSAPLRLLAAALLTLATAAATPAPAYAGATVTTFDSGVPTVDESDFAGSPAGEERETAVLVGYGRPSARISHPGAAYVKVHFAALRLAPGDYVTVADPARREVHT